jgi:GMP synthase-like glutamine amidotransferase
MEQAVAPRARVSMSNCLVVQHVEPEAAFAIGDALARAGIEADVRRVFAGDTVPPDASGHDGVVVMGGPMSAVSDERFPGRRAEISVLADALDRAVPTLGVCLGAQLLAVAAGARVERAADGPEVGWGAVELTSAAGADPLFMDLSARLEVLHWHGDTFELPTGAQRLASSIRYPNQAFRLGDLAWGLQFHLEVTTDAVEAFLRAFAHEAACAPGGAAAVRRATPAAVAGLSSWRELVLDRFAGVVGGARPDRSLHRFADVSEP